MSEAHSRRECYEFERGYHVALDRVLDKLQKGRA